jgi:DNA-binding transcriptional ArsR family regulator
MFQFQLDTEKLEQAAGKLRAMSHPMRIAIIDLLAKHPEPLSVTEIYKSLDIEQATASHHLNILKSKNILISKRDGKNIYYALKNLTITEILECIDRCNKTDY